MEEVIQQLEKAEGPDRDLDLAIANVKADVPWKWMDRDRRTVTSETYGPNAPGNPVCTLESFTGSLDEALILAPGDWKSLRFERTGNTWGCFLDGIDTNAKTCELALCIAGLKARSVKNGELT